VRAKEYCAAPFETRQVRSRKQVVPIVGESIAAAFVQRQPDPEGRQAYLALASADDVPLPPESIDGVFTDPPYFDNVQYAELMDFCYVWLRLALRDEVDWFASPSTRSVKELTGNATRGRDLAHFTSGLSSVFRHYKDALKPGGPFVFTYHHNDAEAYVPIVVAVLDSGLTCTAALPAAAEMAASLHIAGTASSLLDTVFVCREVRPVLDPDVPKALVSDATKMREADVLLTEGDIRCLAAGHIARIAINRLRSSWDAAATPSQRMETARATLRSVRDASNVDRLVTALTSHDGKERTTARAAAAV
jgi:hypothetical protein